MKQLFPLLVAFTLFTSCNGQKNTEQPKKTEAPPEPVSELQSLVNQGIDPYFIETTDTISKYGPYTITRDVMEDGKGNIWFATWQGIIQYDGELFTNYTLKEDLIHFHVLCCHEDRKGNLWFGTARGGVYRYDGNTFTLYTTKEGLVNNNVACIFEDRDGNIWFGTEKGASHYDGIRFTTQDTLTGKSIDCILQDKTGKLWFGGSGGLYTYDGRSYSAFTNKEGKSFDRVWSLLEDRSGNIWIGRFNGLTLYDGNSFTDQLTNFLTYYIIEDRAGNIWLSHSETNTTHPVTPRQVLYRYDGKTFTSILDKYELNDFQVFGKMEDKAGNIWFGTMHGAFRYNGKIVTGFTQ